MPTTRSSPSWRAASDKRVHSWQRMCSTTLEHQQVMLGAVSELCHIAAETPVEQRDLPGHSDAHRCCGKCLLGTVLVGLDVRQHARPEFISKRA
jgi:hypothetical protein